jgi:glycosyltransferase involved in cell wall biosynthesis
MKSCFLVSKSDVGGATVYVHNLVKSLNSTNNVIYYLYEGDSTNQIDRLGPVLIKKSSIGFFNIFRVFISLRSFLSNNDFEFINVHSTEASILLRIAYLFSGKKIRIIYTVHGWGWRGYNRVKSGFIKFTEFVLFKFARNDYIFLYKNMIEESAFLNLNKNKYSIITTGLNQEFITKELSKEFTFVFPARIDRSKNHFGSIKLLSKVKNSNIKLIFVGNGTDNPVFIDEVFNKCEEFGFNKNCVEFLGLQKNMLEVYKRSDMLILISYFEALPLTIIEALTHGIPCIASDLGGVNDLIVNNFNGIIINEKFETKDLELFINKYTFDFASYNKHRLKIYDDSKLRFSKDEMLNKYSKFLNL